MFHCELAVFNIRRAKNFPLKKTALEEPRMNLVTTNGQKNYDVWPKLMDKI